jgi:two-component system chemotaxis response regulator CheB
MGIIWCHLRTVLTAALWSGIAGLAVGQGAAAALSAIERQISNFIQFVDGPLPDDIKEVTNRERARFGPLRRSILMRNIICLGASTDGLEAISRLIGGLPPALPATLFIVRHIGATGRGLLPEILQARCALPISEAKDGEAIANGQVYVAPPDQHMLLDRKVIRLSRGPKENWVRPAIDPLFRTAAQYHGSRVVGIVLSGKLDDGTAGLWAIKRRGGFTAVQRPDDAGASEMPRNAIAAVKVDIVADAEEIGALLPRWCSESHDASPVPRALATIKAENALLCHAGSTNLNAIGTHPGIACPECGGQLWQLKQGPLRFRCHVGHGMSGHTLLAQLHESAEHAGWEFVRALEEEASIIEKLDQVSGDKKSSSRLRKIRETSLQVRKSIQSMPTGN